ncbi:hypothetical protein, partial [Ralstonia sp. 3N]|uniref:hypothetical protein n=1 Tax=Ralstonia sp. 3N TaxID=2675750 RepID=UPI001C12D318
LDVDLQSRAPKYGIGRLYPEAAAGHGRLVSTSADCGKRGHYPSNASLNAVWFMRIWLMREPTCNALGL